LLGNDKPRFGRGFFLFGGFSPECDTDRKYSPFCALSTFGRVLFFALHPLFPVPKIRKSVYVFLATFTHFIPGYCCFQRKNRENSENISPRPFFRVRKRLDIGKGVY